MKPNQKAEIAGREFEAVKLSLAHRSDGYRLTLVVQPDDVDQRIFTDLIGQRYMVVMVPIGDDEQPKVTKTEVKRDRLFVASHTLPKQPKFWRFLEDEFGKFFGAYGSDPGFRIETEEQAAIILRDILKIGSRRALKDNEAARSMLEGMIAEFEQWRMKRI